MPIYFMVISWSVFTISGNFHTVFSTPCKDDSLIKLKGSREIDYESMSMERTTTGISSNNVRNPELKVLILRDLIRTLRYFHPLNCTFGLDKKVIMDRLNQVNIIIKKFPTVASSEYVEWRYIVEFNSNASFLRERINHYNLTKDTFCEQIGLIFAKRLKMIDMYKPIASCRYDERTDVLKYIATYPYCSNQTLAAINVLYDIQNVYMNNNKKITASENVEQWTANTMFA